MRNRICDIEVKGLAELEGGRPPNRLAFDPVANVFDESCGFSEAERHEYRCRWNITGDTGSCLLR
jgi:hypothetical protein